MPTDPTDPKSPNLYRATATAPKGGGGGIVFVILLVLVLGGGLAYYFLVSKPTIAAVPPPTPTPAASVAPTPAPTPVKTAELSKEQRQQYIDSAVESFRVLRQSKAQPFTEAFAALTAAGGLSSASLTSKEAIAARRELIRKCLEANEGYTAFIKDQEAAYTAELKKTPLTPNDVEVESSLAGAKMPTDKIVQLRTLQGESLKTGDQMLEYLDSKFGTWSVNADKHIVVFKKTADGAPFTALAKSYGDQVVALNKLRDEINKNEAADPTAPTAPATATAAPAPAAATVP